MAGGFFNAHYLRKKNVVILIKLPNFVPLLKHLTINERFI
jgi:hypothetical protein